MANKLHILLADIHYPVHCRKSIRAVFQFIERHRANIDSCVLLGDFLDCENQIYWSEKMDVDLGTTLSR